MTKVALVLSGGGAKGAFQVAAEKYAREVKGYSWDLIAGVSVGALNGAMLSQQRFERLEELWLQITPEQVYTGRLSIWTFIRILFGAKSIYGNEPLWDLIQREIGAGEFKTPLRIGTVSLRSGDYVLFEPSAPHFAKALLASTAIPIVWEPVDVAPELPNMVDGGVRNVSPLGDVLDFEPDEIVVINANPQRPATLDRSPRDILAIARRSIDIATNEIFQNDLREFLRINRLVLEAAAQGATLHHENGRPFKYYKAHIIEPDEPLGDVLDFSRKTLAQSMRAGWRQAKRVLG